MILRSKVLPLTVEVNFFKHQSMLEDLIQCMDRVETLTIRGTSDIDELRRSLVHVEAPRLKSLSLGLSFDTAPNYPIDFFRAGAPVVRHLQLKYCLFPPDSPIYDNLTYLDLSRLEFGGESAEHPIGVSTLR